MELAREPEHARKAESLHRRRGRHHRPRDPRAAGACARRRGRQHRPRQAQGRGRAQGAHGRGRPRRAVPSRRCRPRGRSARRCARRREPAHPRRLDRASRGARLDLRLRRARRGPGAGRAHGQARRQSGLLSDRRHRADPAAGRCRPHRARHSPHRQRGQRLLGRRAHDDRGLRGRHRARPSSSTRSGSSTSTCPS